MEKLNHTGLPWTCHSGAVWKDGPDVWPKGEKDGVPIAIMDRAHGNGTMPVERDNNAKFIVLAANSYYDLLDALKTARIRMIRYGESREEITEMDAVIRKAEGRRN